MGVSGEDAALGAEARPCICASCEAHRRVPVLVARAWRHPEDCAECAPDEDRHAFCSAFHCCDDHPIGKPWHYPEAWDRHYAEAHA